VQFTTTMNCLIAHHRSWDPLYFVTHFIDGLKPNIRVVVMVQQPRTLDAAVALACLQEEAVELTRETLRIAPGSSSFPGSASYGRGCIAAAATPCGLATGSAGGAARGGPPYRADATTILYRRQSGGSACIPVRSRSVLYVLVEKSGLVTTPVVQRCSSMSWSNCLGSWMARGIQITRRTTDKLICVRSLMRHFKGMNLL
jgi:hypothetical protein